MALVTLLRLLTDDDYRGRAEHLIRRLGVTRPDLHLDPERLQAITAPREFADDAFRIARTWYAELVTTTLDGQPTVLVTTSRSFLAYLVAALAARAGRLPEARRWLHVGHAEAQADGLGAEEVAVFIAAIHHARG